LTVEVNGRRLAVRVFGAPVVEHSTMSAPRRASRLQKEKPGSSQHGHDGAELTSPLQGTVIRVEVTPGTTVHRGDLVCVVEAMKMENEITAHRDGSISSLAVSVGDAVRIGSVLAMID
jgi:acetyl-CoA/propionyl-CoA carboxylase biotin carboxyl carrier protein